MAQTAIYDGSFVSENIIRIANNKETVPYKAKDLSMFLRPVRLGRQLDGDI